MSGPFAKHPFLLPPGEVAHALKTTIDNGLSSVQVAQLQQECPRNELNVQGSIPWYTIFLQQLFNAMIMVCLHLFLLDPRIYDHPSQVAVSVTLNEYRH